MGAGLAAEGGRDSGLGPAVWAEAPVAAVRLSTATARAAPQRPANRPRRPQERPTAEPTCFDSLGQASPNHRARVGAGARANLEVFWQTSPAVYPPSECPRLGHPVK